ncbi:MAG: hypothetical protein J6C37_09815 [Roseburia sp.]|nr:hypothetical protein [Roseburia sp.]
MSNVFSVYNTLRKKAFRSYWEKRILAEIGYLMELLYKKDTSARGLLEQALAMLMADYRKNDQISVETAKEAEKLLLPLSEEAKRIAMVCAAHAHIDMNWMWGFQETVAVTLDTVRTMLTLMKEYPEFTFSQSQASVYHILEEYAPELLEQVKQRVQEGRWEVTASTWVENDKNMPNGESMVRHLLYTKKYLSKLLDIKEETLNLDFEPDTFGHSYNLPEVLRNGGITRYYHCRGYEGENIYRWRGMSGAEVLVYREPKWYNASIESELCEGIPAFCEKYEIDQILFVYGVGDHGGGPTRRDIERIIDMSSWPLFPKIRFGTYREYYDYLEERKEQFPIVDQELNYVFTGCYTSQSRIKMANRIGEARLTEAEILGSMAKLKVSEYRKGKGLEEAWRKILFNHFHDIIPGSGIIETREFALGEFQKAMAQAGANGVRAMDAICESIADGPEEKNVNDVALGAGVGNGTDRAGNYGFTMTERGGGSVRYLALFNTTQVTRTEPTEITLWDWQEDISRIRITDMNGREYPFQHLGREENWGEIYWGHTCNKLLVWMPVPPVGYTICRIDTREADCISVSKNIEPRTDIITDEPVCLENDKVKAIFDVTTMKCISFVRKSDGKELIHPAKPACGLVLITEETSNGMTSWRVGKSAGIVDLNETCCVRPGKIKPDGLRKELEYEIAGDGLKVRVKIRLDEGSEFLDCQLKTVWTMLGSPEKGVPQLRFMVPTGYEVENYRYSIPFGMIDRAPLAQDVPAIGMGCAVPKDGGSALCMLSDCKYGFRGDAEGLSLDLIRGSYDPDPYPEVGDHMVRIAIGACDPGKENLALLAEQFAHPVIVRSCTARPDAIDACRSLFAVEGGVLSSIKEAEDGNGFMIRVYNPSGEESIMKLCLPGRKVEAHLCDFIENNRETIHTGDGETIEYTLGGNEVCSLRVIVK